MLVGQTNRLLPLLDDRGDRIMDFSTVGYRNGNVPLPDHVTVVPPSAILTLSPVPGDDRAAIQAAIDQVGNLPLNASGFRGVVQLSAGRFDLSAKLTLNKSGVILRGAGDGPDPATSTLLSYTGTARINMIEVNATATRTNRTSHLITDKVVPAGSTSVTVDSTAGWNVGDTVFVYRPATQAWFDDLGMDQLPTPWSGSGFNQGYDRTITHIDQARKRVFFDAPVPNSIERRYTDPAGKAGQVGTNTVVRLQNIGIENLRGDGQAVLTTPDSEAHADTFIYLQNTAHAFVRNVTGQHLVYSTVRTDTNTANVTVDDAHSLDPVSTIQGERRYSFNMSGQLNLMQNLRSDQGRHDFVNNSPSRGPNVFLDAVATRSSNDSGPHQRWSTGTLYDNVTTNQELSVQNRWASGTGHGWTGANMVIWNSTAERFYVTSPPGAQNWVIGSTGPTINGSQYGAPPADPGYYDANNAPAPVTLNGESSLYRAQLAQRLAHPARFTREYWVGDFDGFENLPTDGDAVYVHPAWSAQIPSLTPAPVGPLDRPNDAGRAIPLTFEFDVPANHEVAHALLTLAVRTAGPTAADDQLWLDSLSPLAVASLNSTIVNSSRILTLELLPQNPADVLTILQDGRLNLLLSDDHALDWADLQLTFSPLLPGDANRDAQLTPDDYALLDRGHAQHLAGWSNGDFTHDGTINQNDYLLLDTAFAKQQGGTLPPALLAQRESQFGPAYISELLSSIPEPSATAAACLFAYGIFPRRRTRTS
jgi:hypothetical protein